MTTIGLSSTVARGVDRRLVALIGLLAIGLALGVMLTWWVGAALVAVGLFLATWPMEPFPALLAVTSVATFVNNEGGHLTRELSVVTALLLYALACIFTAALRRRWSLPHAPLTTAIVLLELSTLAAAAHGFLAGNNLRYLGLELLPLSGLLIAPMVGGLRLSRDDLRVVLATLAVVSLGHVALGFVSYHVNH